MHDKPVSESDGRSGPWHATDRPCPNCQERKTEYRSWESSDGGHVDWKYRCAACGHSWWIDGCDS